MVHYKLHYFASRGLAEVARQLFHLGGVEFEDIRYKQDEWPEYKKNFPFDQVPVLEIDDVQIPQSQAIYRYIAKQTGHYGKDDVEQAKIDALADLYKDYFIKTAPYYLAALEIFPQSQEYVDAKYKELVEPNKDNFFGYLKIYLKKSNTGFLAGGELSYVDLIIAEHVNTWRRVLPEYTKGYPEIDRLVENVTSIPKLKEWLERRPVTKF